MKINTQAKEKEKNEQKQKRLKRRACIAQDEARANECVEKRQLNIFVSVAKVVRAETVNAHAILLTAFKKERKKERKKESGKERKKERKKKRKKESGNLETVICRTKSSDTRLRAAPFQATP